MRWTQLKYSGYRKTNKQTKQNTTKQNKYKTKQTNKQKLPGSINSSFPALML